MIVFVNITHNSLNLFTNQTMLQNFHNASIFDFLMMFQFLKGGVDTPQKSDQRNIVFKVGGRELKVVKQY